METNNGFISVSDYAKLRGVSVAAVYKRLGGSLKQYVKEIDGKKFLSVDVLAAEGIKPVEKGFQPGIKPQEAGEHPGEESPGTPASQDTTQPAILEALEALTRQLSEKDKQISRLQEEAAELRQEAAAKDKFIQEQASRLAVLLEQSQELQRNNQILLGLAQGGKPGTPAEEEAQEHPDQEEAPAQATGTPATVAADIQENQEPKKKPGLWKRIWRAINEV